MKKVKDILLIVLGIAITLAIFWFLFFVALPALVVIGLVALLFFAIKGTGIFQKIRGKSKPRNPKDDIKEAEIIEEK